MKAPKPLNSLRSRSFCLWTSRAPPSSERPREVAGPVEMGKLSEVGIGIRLFDPD